MLIAKRGLQMNLGRDAQDWAIRELEAGRDSRHLRQLAGSTETDSVEDLFDRTLRELGIGALPDRESALVLYAQELAAEYLAGRLSRESLLQELCRLCVATDYSRQLYPFYLLLWTLDDLQKQGFSFYLQDVTLENFAQVLRAEIDTLRCTSSTVA